MTISIQIHAAVSRLWECSFSSHEEAVRSPEFGQLVDACRTIIDDWLAEIWDTRPPSRADHAWALENLLKNHGAPWLIDVPPRPERIAKIIERAYEARQAKLVHLLPLDYAPDLPQCRFGPWELRGFTAEELADLMGAARHSRFGQWYETDVRILSHFQWLVLSECADLPPLGARRFPWTGQTFNELLKINPHPWKFRPSIDYGLFVVLMHPWEQGEAHPDQPWEPFGVPWVYTISDDPFQEPPRSPDIRRLAWDVVEEDGRDRMFLQQTEIDDTVLRNLEQQLGELWDLVSEVMPLCGDGHPAINPLLAHFFLRSWLETGLDQLLWHMITIDAALGKKEHGSTKAIKTRIIGLLKESKLGNDFEQIYNLRSDFVHGRKLRRGDIRQIDLRTARSVTRAVLETLFRLARKFPGESRDTILKRLDQ